MPDGRARHLLRPPITATKMDQLDRAQPDGTGPSSESLRHILLLHAVCRLHGLGRNGRPSRRHLAHHGAHCQFHHYPSKIIPRSYPAHAPCGGIGFTGGVDPHNH